MEAGLFTANNVWMMVCTALVFFMHTGFAFLEIGLTRQKNTINILFKNIFIITVGLLMYYIGGFNLMYPGFEDGSLGILDFAGFGIDAPENGMTPDYAAMQQGLVWLLSVTTLEVPHEVHQGLDTLGITEPDLELGGMNVDVHPFAT